MLIHLSKDNDIDLDGAVGGSLPSCGGMRQKTTEKFCTSEEKRPAGGFKSGESLEMTGKSRICLGGMDRELLGMVG